jgi:hypothetical protein
MIRKQVSAAPWWRGVRHGTQQFTWKSIFVTLLSVLITASIAISVLSIDTPWRPLFEASAPSPQLSTPKTTTSWHKYVRASPGTTIHPNAVLSQYTRGNVENPNGVVNGDGATVLKRATINDTVPQIVVDFGQNTVGILSIEFDGSTSFGEGRPGIRLAFSETLQFLTDVSDFSRSYNVGTLSTESG